MAGKDVIIAGQRNPLSESQNVKMESGTVNHGLDYECRVITYFAMLLNNMDSIIDFAIYTSPLGLKPIDDIVAEIKFKDQGCEKSEIWLTQIKHVETKELRYHYSQEKKETSQGNQQDSAQKEPVEEPKKQQKYQTKQVKIGTSQGNQHGSKQKETVKEPKRQQNYQTKQRKIGSSQGNQQGSKQKETVEEQKRQQKCQTKQVKIGTNQGNQHGSTQNETAEEPKRQVQNQRKQVKTNKDNNQKPPVQNDQNNEQQSNPSSKDEEETNANRQKEEVNLLNINLARYVNVLENTVTPTIEKSDIRHLVNKSNVTKLLFFTNAKPMSTDSSSKTLPLPLTAAESCELRGPFKDLVDKLGNDKCMKCSDKDQLVSEEFLNKFYTFVLQPNVDEILETIEQIDMMKGFSMTMVKQLCNLVEKHMSSLANFGLCTKLTKTDLRDICLTTVVMTRVCGLRTCTRIKAEKQYADIWADIFNKYQIVQLNAQYDSKDSERLLQNITGYYELLIQKKYDPTFDWENCFQSCFQLNESLKKKVRNIFTLADLLLHMWKFDRLPLVIDESINNLFFKFLHSTSTDKQFTGCYFVIAKPEQFSRDIKQLGQISKLSKDDQIYNEIINLEISLQGRKPVPLGKVFEDMGPITATQILLWTGQEKKCERRLYQKKRSVTLPNMANSYDKMSAEIYLDIEDSRKGDKKQEGTEPKTPEQIESDLKNEEAKKKEMNEKVSVPCKNILNQAIREGDFLMWKGDHDGRGCKLSKTRTIFEHENKANRKKLSLELEQQLVPEAIMQLCETMSKTLDPLQILNDETGHSVLKWKGSQPVKSMIYRLSLNIYVTHHDDTLHKDHKRPFDKLDFETVKRWMDSKEIGIDDLVPKEIIIEQAVDIVPEPGYRLKGGKLELSLHRKNDDITLQEIIQRCVDVFNVESVKEDLYTNPRISKNILKHTLSVDGCKLPKTRTTFEHETNRKKCPLQVSIPQIGNNLQADKADRTIIERWFKTDNSPKCSEDKMGSRERKQLVAISNIPGMGKTTVLKSIASRCNPEDYVLFYNLANYDQNLKDLINDPVKNMFKMNKQNDDLEESVFNQHVEKKRIKILLDSFDEILPAHERDVLDLLGNVLKEEMYTTVTTRNQAEDLLTTEFGNVIEIVNLLEFDDEDVKMFCEKEDIHFTYIDKFEKRFLNIPLHLEMLRVIIEMKKEEKSNHDKTEEKFVLCDFYELFIDLKVDIFIEKNKLRGNTLQQLGLTRKEQMYDYLYDLSLVCIFGRENTKDIIDDDKLKEKVDKFNKYVFPLGIASQTGKDNIKFTHRSYAEYLVAKWFCIEFQLKHQDARHKKLYFKILENNEVLLLNFLNDKATMTEGCELHKAIMNNNKQLTKTMLETQEWVQQKPDLLGRYPIDVAAGLISDNYTESDYFEILKMLFNSTPDDQLLGYGYYWHWDESVIRMLGRYYKQHQPLLNIVYENNTSLHLAVTVGDIDRLKYLVENACTHSYLHRMNYDGWNILHLATYNGHEQIVRYLVEEIKMNSNQSTKEQVPRYALELAELSKTDRNTKNTIISVLMDNGCLASKILPTTENKLPAFTLALMLALAQKLSRDANCRDFEIFVNLPNLSMFNNILIIYTSQDEKKSKTTYFVEPRSYKMNLIVDKNTKASGGDKIIPLEEIHTIIQEICSNNFKREWKSKLANIENADYVLCMYIRGTLKPEPLTTVESPLSTCSQQKVYCISSDKKIFVFTKTISHVQMHEQFEKEMGFEPYTGKHGGARITNKIIHLINSWMSSTKMGCRPLTKQIFELICFKHKLKIPFIHEIPSRTIHPNLFDKWVRLFHHNQLTYMNDDDDLVALIAGYFEQFINLQYDTSFEWNSSREGNLPANIVSSIFNAYSFLINPSIDCFECNDLLDVLWIFDRQPLVIKHTENLDKDLRTYDHLKKSFIVLIDKENRQFMPAETSFNASHRGVSELVHGIERLTGKTLTSPYTISDLLRASEFKKNSI